MSGEIVVLAPLLAVAPAAIAAAAPFMLVGGGLLAAARVGGVAMDALEEAGKRRVAERQREIEALGLEIARMANSVAEKAPAVLTAEFLEENRKSVEDALNSLDLEKAVLDIEEYKKPGDLPDRPDAARECRKIYAALSILNASAARSREKFMLDIESAPGVRQKAVRDDLRFEYGAAIRESAAAVWRKRKVSDALDSLSGDDAREFRRALDAAGYPNARLSEEVFKDLQKAYASILEKDIRRKQSALLEERLIANMKSLGYSPVGAASPEAPIFFYTGEKDYRVMARINNGHLSLRFVRVAADEKEKNSLTTAQKRRDIEQEKKWCANASKLLDALARETGAELKELYRKEPDEGGEVLAIVDPALAADKARSLRHAENWI